MTGFSSFISPDFISGCAAPLFVVVRADSRRVARESAFEGVKFSVEAAVEDLNARKHFLLEVLEVRAGQPFLKTTQGF